MKPISELSRTTHIVKAEPLMSFQYRRVKKGDTPFYTFKVHISGYNKNHIILIRT